MQNLEEIPSGEYESLTVFFTKRELIPWTWGFNEALLYLRKKIFKVKCQLTYSCVDFDIFISETEKN